VTRHPKFTPEALSTYRALRADRANEAGQRVKEALERLLADPGDVRGDCSRWDSLAGRVWALPVTMPAGETWLIVWDELPDAIEVFYIGPAPGEKRSDLAWSSENKENRRA
jgi:hypothetical protein